MLLRMVVKLLFYFLIVTLSCERVCKRVREWEKVRERERESKRERVRERKRARVREKERSILLGGWFVGNQAKISVLQIWLFQLFATTFKLLVILFIIN